MASKKAKKAAKPRKLTPKQERFAQVHASGKSQADAYRAAFNVRPTTKPETVQQCASRLMADRTIAARVVELQGKAAAKAIVTVESLATELEEARGIALAEKQSSAAVAATLGKAKLFGLGVEHRRLSGHLQLTTVTADDLKGLTRDELAMLEAALPILQKIGLADGDSDEEESA